MAGHERHQLFQGKKLAPAACLDGEGASRLGGGGKSLTGRMSKASDGDQSMTRPLVGSRVCQ